jgi:hypothetical protein
MNSLIISNFVEAFNEKSGLAQDPTLQLGKDQIIKVNMYSGC